MADNLLISDPMPEAPIPPLSAASDQSEEPSSVPPAGDEPHGKGNEATDETPPSEVNPGPPDKKPPETPDGGDGSPDGEGQTPSNKHWYVVKVQSGREESIKEAIERRVKIEGLEEYFGQVIIPVERVTMMRNGKRIQREQKLYPGYLMVEVEFNDRILYLFRETSGVGDFVGGGVNRAPTPMTAREVERMLGRQGQATEKVVPGKPAFDRGDRVKVKDGIFAGMEGEVKELIEAKGLVRVELTIFGRPVPHEFEYWQVEPV
jgi:transcriptional antiterminator NusG